MKISMVLTVVASIAIGTIIHADTHYVSKSGSNTLPYTSWATAADTVARAVEAASEWDTIQIAAGNFVTDTIRMKRGQVLLGAGVGLTIFDSLAIAPLYAIVTGDSSTLEHFTLQGGNGFTASTTIQSPVASINGGENAGIRIGTDQAVTIRNIDFIELTDGVSALHSDLSGLGRQCVIDSCRFIDCRSAILGIVASFRIMACNIKWDRRGRGIDLDFCDVSITNCHFIAYDPSTQDFGGIAIRTIDCDPIIIRNNLMVSSLYVNALVLNAGGNTNPIGLGIVENNTIIGFNVHLKTSRSGIVFRNNICSKNNASVLFTLEQPISTYNLTWDNSPWDSGIVKPEDTIANDIPGNMENVNRFPMFVDTMEYLLQAYSPAIDAGDPSILDADGSRSDIGHTGGPGGVTYVYQDLPPKVPVGLAGPLLLGETTIEFTWRPNHEADLDHYELNADIIPCWDSSACGIITIPKTDTSFFYTHSVLAAEFLAYFSLSAVDQQGNRSAFSDSVFYANASVGDELVPQEFTLYPNYPNPFNASTQITYTLPEPSAVTLTIYDVMGRHVSTLVSAIKSAGAYSTTWNGTDDQGNAVGSGVYFYRLTVGDEVTARKMVLLK